MLTHIGVTNDPAGVEQKDSRACNLPTLWLVEVPHPIGVNRGELNIAKQRERQLSLRYRLAQCRGRFRRDCHDLRSLVTERLIGIAQLPELPPARWSPVPPVEEEDDVLPTPVTKAAPNTSRIR